MDRVESGQAYQDGMKMRDYDLDSNQRRDAEHRAEESSSNLMRQTHQNRDWNSGMVPRGNLDEGL